MLHRYVVVNVINVIMRFLKPRYNNHWFKSRPRSIIVINVSEFLRSVGTLVIVRPEYMKYLKVREPLLNLIIAYRKNRFWNECSNNHTNRPQIHTEAKDFKSNKTINSTQENQKRLRFEQSWKTNFRGNIYRSEDQLENSLMCIWS